MTRHTKNTKTGSEPQAQESSFPLFFSNPIPLNSRWHAKAGIRLNVPLEFARKTNSIPINAVELAAAVKYYPVVFTMDELMMPVVIVGLEQENLCIDENGKWREDMYVPEYVRKYPFAFSESSEKEKLTLCVDEKPPHFVERATGKNVIRLFEGSAPTGYTKDMLKLCTEFYNQSVLTRRFCDILKNLDLLELNRSNAELSTGRKISLGGFQLVNQEKFRKLPDNKIVELHQQGWLPLIYYVVLSTSNWGRILGLASARETKG